MQNNNQNNDFNPNNPAHTYRDLQNPGSNNAHIQARYQNFNQPKKANNYYEGKNDHPFSPVGRDLYNNQKQNAKHEDYVKTQLIDLSQNSNLYVPNRNFKIFNFKGVSPLVVFLVLGVLISVIGIIFGSVYVSYGLTSINKIKDAIGNAGFDSACSTDSNGVNCIAKTYAEGQYYLGISSLVLSILLLIGVLVYYFVKIHFSTETEKTTEIRIVNKTEVFKKMNSNMNTINNSQDVEMSGSSKIDNNHGGIDLGGPVSPTQLPRNYSNDNQNNNRNSNNNGGYQNPFSR